MDNIASCIDHTLLDPSAPFGRYTELCREAIKYKFKSVCVNPFFVPLINKLLEVHPKIGIASVISFPFGLENILSKCEEINNVIAHGATELDIVANLSSIKSGDFKRFEDEIRAIREVSEGHTLKVILEVGLLTDDEIKHSVDICCQHYVSFVKTSTGYLAKLTPQETARYVKLMVDCTKDSITKVKASGGIKTLDDLNLMIEAGATRIGTSSGVKIMEEFNAR